MTRNEYYSFSTKFFRENFYFVLIDSITDSFVETFNDLDELADFLKVSPSQVVRRFRLNQSYSFITFIEFQRYVIKAYRKSGDD